MAYPLEYEQVWDMCVCVCGVCVFGVFVCIGACVLACTFTHAHMLTAKLFTPLTPESDKF